MKKITLCIALLYVMCSLEAQVTTGEVTLSTDYTAQIDINASDVTVTLVGPDDRWLGLGFGVDSMTNDGDIISFDSSGLNDRRFIGVGSMPPTDTQDWTIVSNNTAGGERTLVVTRGLSGSDSTDYTFDPADTNILLVWARGNGTLDFSNHGSGNRGATVAGFTLGVNDLAFAETVSLYPNPTSDMVNISFDNNVANGEITLFSAIGQTVMTKAISSQEATLDISGINAGIYVLRITSDNGVATKRIIKQ
ncbi:MAG: hypothetical protein ACI828_000251 [Flavobacteriales bacterium]|jgi:hypothetical protein